MAIFRLFLLKNGKRIFIFSLKYVKIAAKCRALNRNGHNIRINAFALEVFEGPCWIPASHV